MLKKNALRRICISTFSLFIVLLLCIFPNNETSYPEEIIGIYELTMPLYIKDQNGYVARTNIIKKKDNDIEYIINLLTKGSLYENYLPVNFEPLIPENTKLLNYSLNDKVLKLNFSKEFLLVNENDEEKMIESLIYSLCELESIDKILNYDNKKIKELLENTGIIRNKLKINATINNSKIFKEIQKEYGSFDKYIWSFTNGEIVVESFDKRTFSPLSDEISKDLKKRGMKFVGTTIIYSYLQAIGIINGHSENCDKFKSD